MVGRGVKELVRQFQLSRGSESSSSKSILPPYFRRQRLRKPSVLKVLMDIFGSIFLWRYVRRSGHVGKPLKGGCLEWDAESPINCAYTSSIGMQEDNWCIIKVYSIIK
jgi:hypothetical protein